MYLQSRHDGLRKKNETRNRNPIFGLNTKTHAYSLVFKYIIFKFLLVEKCSFCLKRPCELSSTLKPIKYVLSKKDMLTIDATMLILCLPVIIYICVLTLLSYAGHNCCSMNINCINYLFILENKTFSFMTFSTFQIKEIILW